MADQDRVKFWRRTLYIGGGTAIAGILAAGVGLLAVLYSFGSDLPDIEQLKDYEPPVTTRVHASDGRLLTEFARQRRLFVPISAIPNRIVNAFLAAEDQHFYSHDGLDFIGIVRAALTNLVNVATDRRLVGASTITQQVAKNFLLTGEVSYERKIREAILAYRIEQAFTKEEILELYLNEIYLGLGSYGVAAASLNYFDKSLSELSLSDIAYLAALPKAPNNYHPTRRTDAAIGRRNWVLGRMAEENFITDEQAKMASQEPLNINRGSGDELFNADYFNEEIRRQLQHMYGNDALYEGGLSVRTSLDPRLQTIAEDVLQLGLITYDRRHGWRGPVGNMNLEFMQPDDWQQRLADNSQYVPLEKWRLSVVLNFEEKNAVLGFEDGTMGVLRFEDLRWARRWLSTNARSSRPKSADDLLKAGDMVLVERVMIEDQPSDFYSLQQKPAIEGALVAMDPHTGRVLALVGGFDFSTSEFNRATQAKRQPGSAFKPFVYAAALDQGYTPSDLVLDAPFVIDQGYGQGKWKPANYSNKFYGPSTLRLGIEKSRNLMTVRLAQSIGMDPIVDYAKRFGLVDDMPATLAMSLGAAETTLLRITAAYAMLVNGGKKITPTMIDRIQDRRGDTVYRSDDRPCDACLVDNWEDQPMPVVKDGRETVIDPGTAYQITSFLEGVVLRGTGVRIRAVGKPLAGKTGTTNDSQDTWFIGFSPDLAVGVFAGFDQPKSLGKKETGSSVAAPIFRDFFKEALADAPATPFRIPPGIRLVRVNVKTGLPTTPDDKNVILEAFKPGTEPKGPRMILDGSIQIDQMDDQAPVGTGGLY
ncbi:MAG: penicillin-binding protein 1A [Alphaproteobacteria bacterium]|nr:MAG: penicillin-binding protein 1A [Alphaproteobacteria bacterium]